jgi:glycosyltransferase involved in cell wall biosynthesis
MAGPAIRALELAKQLASEFDVTVFSPQGNASELSPSVYGEAKVQTGKNKSVLAELAGRAEIIVVQANVLKTYPFIGRLDTFLVVDLYDPYLFMIHIQYAEDNSTASASYRLMHQVLAKHMIHADFSICASERQRDYWIGRYCALGRVDTRMYRFDSSLRKLIDVVPFGLPDSAPVKNGPGLRALLPSIQENDPVLIWGGGIWDWFDPLTVINAVNEVQKQVPNVRLVFMGTRSPNPQVAEMRMATGARTLAESLGLLDKNVFFADRWIPYEERVNFLLEADIAVSAHFDLPETRYSFRTRILDYLWCHLPIITTGGDSFADLIARDHAGITVPYGDVTAWKTAILSLLSDSDLKKKCSLGAAKIAKDFTWQTAVEPLRAYCRNPHSLPVYSPVKMPSILERAQAVYSRGGKEMIIKRSGEVLKDMLK